MTRVPSPESSAFRLSYSILTSPGRGAVAVVRVWGPGALGIANRAFRPNRGRRLAGSPRGQLRVGRVGVGLGDEVVAVVVGGKAAEVEIQCHGGSAAVTLVAEALESGGAMLRPPGAWVGREGGSRLRAEAAVALGRASTIKVASILLDQFEGALDEELRRALKADRDVALALLDGLIERATVGTRLVEGWRVVLAGRPNVGKSRLLNALAGYDRAIVAPTPGTTRDVVTATVALEGWPVELADTAGLRPTLDPIEAEGVAQARSRHREADLVVVILDRSVPLEGQDLVVLAGHRGGLVVANKSDLPASWDESEQGALAVSAERGDGVDGLVRAIADRLVPDPPLAGSGVPFRAVHARRLRAIRANFATNQDDRARRSLRDWLG